MSALAFGTERLRRVSLGPLALSQLLSPLLLLVIGAELAILVEWLPDTLAAWKSGEAAGDFKSFYRATEQLQATGLYSPRRTLLLYPLTYLSVTDAYRIFTALGVLAALAAAYLAQRGVTSWEGRTALALGMLSLPQLHWALRIGHFTPMLMLAALGGFLLLRKRPVLAGLCFAFVAIKPQYVVVPAAYLLATRNGRALAALAGGVIAIEIAGFALVGFEAAGAYLRQVWDWGLDPRDDRAVAQVWQYSWGGFLASLGATPHPLVVIDLIALSFGAVVLVWKRGAARAALPATAFGMLLVAPYANFYDWALIAVGAALLVRAELHGWAALTPVALLGLYALMLSAQEATPYPPDLASSSVTNGVFWITPALLLVVSALALTGERRFDRARQFFAGLRGA